MPPTPPSSRPDGISPRAVSDLRERLTKGEDIVDPKSWAGSVPAAFGIAPRLRIGAKRWFNLAWLVPIGWVLLLLGVGAAQVVRGVPVVEGFVRRYPGSEFAVRFGTAMPAWVRAQHFLNLFFLTFIIRAGAQILADHPRLYWTRHSTPGKEWLRMQKQVPDAPLWTAKQDSLTLPKHIGLPGLRHSIGLARWWHLGVDTLWLANGLVF
jgi:sulfoxide reductase catalytic subunit YedY